jgi:hypothetical protein
MIKADENRSKDSHLKGESKIRFYPVLIRFDQPAPSAYERVRECRVCQMPFQVYALTQRNT